jgi:uncharacterized membrane protein (UPF0182 family)
MTKQVSRLLMLLGLLLIWDCLSHLLVEVLWFQELGYLAVFFKRLETQILVWLVVWTISAGCLGGNFWLASRLKYQESVSRIDASFSQLPGKSDSKLRLPKSRNELALASLLPLVIGLGLLVGFMLLQYGKIVSTMWHSEGVITLIPSLWDLAFLRQLFSWQEAFWQLPVLVGVIGVLIITPQFWLNAIAFLLSLFFGFVISGNWSRILQYITPTAFNSVDPVFGHDLSFYVFSFPLWQLLEFWLSSLFIFALVAVSLSYLLSGKSLSNGKFPGFSQNQLRHLYGLSSLVALTTAVHYWLHRYQLLYLTNGSVYGAGYTDINIQLPVDISLIILALVCALFFLWRLFFRSEKLWTVWRLLSLYLALIFIANFVIPTTIQRLVVQPNELARERPYLKRSIDFTRAAFDLNNIEVKTFAPQGKLTQADIQANNLTIRNIRIWDTRPLLETNRQLQQIRLYYKFFDADIDRYTIQTDLDKQDQQVIITARELDYNAVPQQAQTWINKHLIYTHGYGFTLSPVNTVAPGGLPDYFVKDIGTSTRADDNNALQTANENIRSSIPIGIPRIYYGELTDTYVMTSTNIKEFDYPSGNENVYNVYDGKGGVAIKSWWKRLVFAQALKDWQMVFTNNFTSSTKLLFRRNINERIREIAPFLRYDSDPYLVIADNRKSEQETNQNFLYWMVDAYTTSAHYPYSDPGQHQFNYIRNSVKVVVDAYNGDVSFYVADPKDPIINSWQKIFPGLFKPINAMPEALRKHIRYPEDLFSVQSERLLTYHMIDPQVFYNREDQWQIPNEIYGNKSQPVKPYYLIMKLPTEKAEEFILLHPFTPTKRNNLIAWLAARSDGENYGKLLLYRFPKQELVYGTEQIEARINQDPVISQQITLWNREGSRAIQGNLLVIPIERSLLYVEPIYLEAERNSLPTLVRVIVAYENKIVMAETLEDALQTIFSKNQPKTPPIVRPVK